MMYKVFLGVVPPDSHTVRIEGIVAHVVFLTSPVMPAKNNNYNNFITLSYFKCSVIVFVVFSHLHS